MNIFDVKNIKSYCTSSPKAITVLALVMLLGPGWCLAGCLVCLTLLPVCSARSTLSNTLLTSNHGRGRGCGSDNNFSFLGQQQLPPREDDSRNTGIFTRLFDGPKVQGNFPKVFLKADPPGTERDFCFIGSTKGLYCKFGSSCNQAHITRLDQVSKGIFDLAQIVKNNPKSIQWTNEEDSKIASKASKGE